MCAPKPMLSSLYDSVVQRSLLIRKYNRDNRNPDKSTGSENENYRSRCVMRYKAALRWDMLMFGTVALTDAMWYDGLLFSQMIDEGDFEEFKHFLSENKDALAKPILIRQRANYRKMFCKSFHYSSVINAQLQNLLMKEPGESGELARLADDPDISQEKLKSAMEKELKSDVQSGKNAIADNVSEAFESLMRQLSILGDLPKGVAIQWEAGRSAFMNCVYKKPKNIIKKYRNNMEALSEKFRNIEMEINRNTPRRSFIIHELETCEIHDDIWFDFAQEFGTEFYKAYNIAIAEQHRCHYIEQYEPLEREYIQGKMESGLLYELLESLAGMSWEEYNALYSDTEIVSLRNDWLLAYESQLSGESNLADVKRKMIDYLENLLLAVDRTSGYLSDHILFYYNDIAGNDDEGLDVSGAGQMLIADKLSRDGAYLEEKAVISKGKLHFFEIDNEGNGLKLRGMCREIIEEPTPEEIKLGKVSQSLFKDFLDFVKVPEDGTKKLVKRRSKEEARTGVV